MGGAPPRGLGLAGGTQGERGPAPGVERLHHRVRAHLADLLERATPAGFAVSAWCTWQHGPVDLPVDVAVHADDGLASTSVPPVLCVDLVDPRVAELADARRRRRAYAGLGVDHVWQLDVPAARLDVFVRVRDDYRHAETLTGTDWLDFGIGLVHLDVPQLLAVPQLAT